MAVAGGLNSQLGIGEETTPGTAVTPSRFYDFGQESLKQSIERIEYMGLRPTRRVLGSTNWVPGRIGVEGDIELPWMNKGMGLIAKHMLGAVATTTPTGGTLTRDHKATVGAIDGKGLTVQVGRTSNDGTTRPFTYAGCKVAKWSLKHDTQSQLMLTLSLDGMSESTATGLASASYPSGLTPFAYTKGILTVGGSSVDVMDWSLDADNGLATDRYFIRSGGANKKEQLEGAAVREYTGQIHPEFSDLTLYNNFVNGSLATFSAVYTGALIEGALNYQLTVSLAAIRFDGETPTVGGVGLLDQPLPFKVVDSGAADGPVVLVVRSDDTTP